jgi:hypothetical protein
MLAPALFGAILNAWPVLGPLLAPFKLQTAALAYFGFKPIFGLGYWWHGLTLRVIN